MPAETDRPLTTEERRQLVADIKNALLPAHVLAEGDLDDPETRAEARVGMARALELLERLSAAP